MRLYPPPGGILRLHGRQPLLYSQSIVTRLDQLPVANLYRVAGA